MIPAILTLTALGLALGTLLGFAARAFHVEADPVTEQIEALLPGSNCGQCGYPGCGPAAAVVAAGEAPVTLCPPGGRALAEEMAATLGIEVDLSAMEDRGPLLATVDEADCIGCTRCFKVCPTDAVMGGPKQIHAVFAEACTGCGKCIDVCPTECLRLIEEPVTVRTWHWPRPALAA